LIKVTWFRRDPCHLSDAPQIAVVIAVVEQVICDYLHGERFRCPAKTWFIGAALGNQRVGGKVD
jgi:hypothetical protein